jgi:hypothetical protein
VAVHQLLIEFLTNRCIRSNDHRPPSALAHFISSMDAVTLAHSSALNR